MPKRADHLGAWFREYTDCYRNRKLRRLSESAQLRFVWLCALHKEGKLVGASIEDIAYDLRLPDGDVQESLDTLRASDLIGLDNAPLAWEERQPKSDTSRERTAAWRDKKKENSGDVTVTSQVTACDGHVTGLDQTRQDKTIQSSGEAPDPVPFREIVDHLNAKTGSQYRHTSKATRAHIRARWAEGARLWDFEAVIDAKAAEWGRDQKWAKFLRPETLFGAKFEGYREGARKNGKRARDADDDMPDLDAIAAAARGAS